jgi:DNA-directed RNA polymerase sigma subunit (sigma70/sigma32)
MATRKPGGYKLDIGQIDLEKHPECKDMGLVFTLARMYWRVWGGRLPGLEFDDLIQIGYVALRSCRELYDESLGKYGAYAGKAIRHGMERAITQGRHLIHIPGCAHRLVNFLEQGKALPYGKAHTVKTAKAAQRARKMVQGAVDDALAVASVGLDTTWIDIEALNEGMKHLPPKEQMVLRLHYGLEDNEPLTFEQIGERWPKRKVTRQAAQLAHRSALETLRKLMGVA